MRSVLIGAASFLTMISAANATIIDLSGFSNGETFDTGDIAGLTVTTVTDNGGAADDFAFVLDTNNPGSDGDLAAPFDDPSTIGDENFNPGNVLALAEEACGGGFCPVNDNGSGGTMEWVFNRNLVFNSLNVYDFRQGELKIDLFNDLNVLVFSAMVPGFNTDTGNATDDNLFATIDIGGIAFRRAVFDFGGSGAIGTFDIQEVPVPAALPLLLSGLAGLGFARKRRKKA